MILPIKHKRGTTIPTANDLVVGEIAINTATGVCYTKTGAGNVVAIGLDIAANWGNIGGTLSSQTDLSNALALKADLSGASFSGTVYAPGFRNLLNADLVIDSYNDTGAGTHYLHKFTPFDGKFVLAPNGGGLTFPDGSTQTTSAVSFDPTGYATESWVQMQGYLLPGAFGTVPAGGLMGQVLTKDSSLDYAHSWVTPIVGDRYLTTSTTSNTVSNGVKTFTVGTGLSYTPQQDVTIATPDGVTAHMHALVTTYNSLTGALVVDVAKHTGSGTYALWTVNVGGIVPLEAVSWGGITGTLTNQTDLVLALSAKASLAGDTFTGKVSTTATATTAPLNVAVSTSSPTTTVAGDVWVGTNNFFFKDSTNAQRIAANVNSQNTFQSPQIISATTTSTLLRITQTGTGNAFIVEDFGNPDVSAFVINNAGVVGIQKDPATWVPVAGVALDVTGKVVTASTSAYAGLNLGSGVAPTTPVQGDIWMAANTDNLRYRSPLNNLTLEVATRNAVNQFTSGQAITVNSTTNALRINQLGTGPALVVEDSTNPDTTSFVVDAAGNVGVGVNPTTWGATRKLEVVGSISCTTEPATTDSVDVATTAHVKSVMRGQVISNAAQTYTLPSNDILPNVIVKKANDGTGNTTYIEVPYNVIPVGTQFVLIQVGTYPFVVQPASGVTINSSGGKYRSGGEHSVCTLIKTAANEWYLAGDLTT